MAYMSVQEAAELWGISDRRVRTLCSEGRIPGVIKEKGRYKIPLGSLKPADGRSLRGKKIPSKYKESFLRIDAKKMEIEKRRPFTEGEVDRLRKEFLLGFTYDSNAIEGSTLTLQETALVLQGLTVNKPLKEHLKAIGHRDAFEYVIDLVSENIELTETIIKTIQSLVLIDRPRDRGSYRRIPVKISGTSHEPPQPYLINVEMEKLTEGYKESASSLHDIERIARFHLDFENIHPFINGNGRTGRLILNLELMKNGYPPVSIKFSDRARYYQAFNDYDEKKTPDMMVEFLTDYLEEELDRYLEIL